MNKILKISIYICASLLIFIEGHAQKPYSIAMERFKPPGSKDKVMEKAHLWILADKDLKFVGSDTEQGLLYAESSIDYTNEVVLEMAFLTPRIGEKTSGIITYDLIVHVNDTSYTVEFTNFTHTAQFEPGKYSFGLIPKYADDFNKKCTENPDWCKLVWMDITKTAKIKTRMMLIKANW